MTDLKIETYNSLQANTQKTVNRKDNSIPSIFVNNAGKNISFCTDSYLKENNVEFKEAKDSFGETIYIREFKMPDGKIKKEYYSASSSNKVLTSSEITDINGLVTNHTVYNDGKKYLEFNYDTENKEFTNTIYSNDGEILTKVIIKNGKMYNYPETSKTEKQEWSDKKLDCKGYMYPEGNPKCTESYDKSTKQLISIFGCLEPLDINTGNSGRHYIIRFDPNTKTYEYKQTNGEMITYSFKFTEQNKIEDKSAETIKDFAEISERYNAERSAIEKQTKNDIPNGEIDKAFSQGNIGDCWVLSSLISMSQNPATKKILEDCITFDEQGNTVITFKNIGKRYTITSADMQENSNYSKGDADIRALEIAIEKYMSENTDTMKCGGTEDKIFEIFLGNGKHHKDIVTDELINQFNDKNKIFTVGFGNSELPILYKNKDNKNILHIGHAYSIKYSDEKFVYIINPHNSSKVIPVDRETFKKYAQDICSANI